MRLGLVGLGKQGQRYLQEKNGGRHIVRSGSRDLDDWKGLDGVIIATHPAGHKALALKAIERGLPVLIEKPLALNLADCMYVINAAEKAKVKIQVAHTHLWCNGFRDTFTASDDSAQAFVEFDEHHRNYPPWLDWAPHLLAMLAALDVRQHPAALNARCHVALGSRRLRVLRRRSGSNGLWDVYQGRDLPDSDTTPMANMVNDFVLSRWGSYGWASFNYDFNRRIYRALFSEEHG